MTLFDMLFTPTIIVALGLGYLAVKNKWKIADIF